MQENVQRPTAYSFSPHAAMSRNFRRAKREPLSFFSFGRALRRLFAPGY
jgi:hypothetical protein